MKAVRILSTAVLVLVLGVFSANAAPPGMETVPAASNNVGVADCNVTAVSKNIIAIAMDEWEQSVDYNGDGDTSDYVLGYYDVLRSSLVNTTISIGDSIAIDGDTIAFWFDDSGTLGYYSIKDGTSTDTGITIAAFGRSYQGPAKAVSNNRIVYTMRDRDLNGDGTADYEACYYDISSGSPTCPGIIAYNPTISGDLIAYKAGPSPLYGAIKYYDIATGTEHDTGLTGRFPVVDNDIIVFSTGGGITYYNISTGASGVTPLSSGGSHSVSNGIISYLADEGAYWGDLNGDGDTSDYYIVVYYDINSGRLVNTAVKGCCGTDISNGVIVFDTYENDVQTDLNGDGDLNDCVQQYVRITGVETIPHTSNNVGVADCDVTSVSQDGIIAIAMDEWEQSVDFNGDGDTSDYVLGYYDTVKAKLTNTGISIWSNVAIDGDFIAFELESGTLAYYEIRGKKLHDTGIVAADFGRGYQGPARALSNDKIVYTMRDRDLDGDGTADYEACYYDISSGSPTCPGIIAYNPTISGDLIAYKAGPSPLYGAIKYYDIATGTEHDTGLTGRFPVVDNDIIVFSTGDGVSYFNTATNEYRLTPLSSGGSHSVSNGIISYLADEGAYWGDLNGDGDTSDYYIVVYYDINTGRLVNTTVLGCCGTDISNGIIVFDSYEYNVQQDLNGDGDLNDCVQQYVVALKP